MSKFTSAEVGELERKISQGYTLSNASLIQASEMLRYLATLLAESERGKPPTFNEILSAYPSGTIGDAIRRHKAAAGRAG